jgi:hypothetical protein
VQPFSSDAGAQGRSPISINGGFSARWSHDGKQLFFQDLTGVLMAADIRLEPTAVHADKPHPVFTPDTRMRTGNRQFDVTADDQRFLMILPSPEDSEPVRLTIVSNWPPSIAIHHVSIRKISHRRG